MSFMNSTRILAVHTGEPWRFVMVFFSLISMTKIWDLVTLSLKKHVCLEKRKTTRLLTAIHRVFCVCVCVRAERRPSRTRCVWMWSWLRSSGRRSMKERRKRTRPWGTPSPGWRTSSTAGGTVRGIRPPARSFTHCTSDIWGILLCLKCQKCSGKAEKTIRIWVYYKTWKLQDGEHTIATHLHSRTKRYGYQKHLLQIGLLPFLEGIQHNFGVVFSYLAPM